MKASRSAGVLTIGMRGEAKDPTKVGGEVGVVGVSKAGRNSGDRQ